MLPDFFLTIAEEHRIGILLLIPIFSSFVLCTERQLLPQITSPAHGLFQA